MKILSTYLLLFSLIFSGCVNSGQNSKELRNSQQEVPVYAPRVKGPLVESQPVKSPSIESPPKTEDTSWQLRESKEGIPVYTRKDPGSPILEYKASVIVDAPIARAIALFEDENQISRWYFQCVHSELVEHEGPKNEVIYLVLHLPWPVAPRDFVFRRARTDDTARGTISYNLTALPDRLPLVKGIIRVNAIKSVWIFKPLPGGQTEIFFQQHTDPAGSVPVSIINQLAAQTPFFSLKNFRRLIIDKDVKS